MKSEKINFQNDSSKQLELLTNVNQEINELNQKLSSIQERISVGVKEATHDYEELCEAFKSVGKQLQMCRDALPPDELRFYLFFLEINSNFHILQNKIEITHYLIMIFENLLK